MISGYEKLLKDLYGENYWDYRGWVSLECRGWPEIALVCDKALRSLPRAREKALRLRYGLVSLQAGKTHDQVGANLRSAKNPYGVSSGRSQQLVASGLRMLRHSTRIWHINRVLNEEGFIGKRI